MSDAAPREEDLAIPWDDLPVVEAGGGVVWREERSRPVILLVHRPRYDDWTLPKGKRDRGDADLRDCALREVREETGIDTTPGPVVGDTEYRVTTKRGKAARKFVRYWLMRAEASSGRPFEPNKEVDAIRWVDVEVAPSVLTYERDREVLSMALPHLGGSPAAGTGPQLTHLALGVADLAASATFYEEFCGMVRIHEREEGGVRVAWLGDPNRREESFVLVLAEGLEPNQPLGPFAHLGFAVGTRAEVDEIAARGVDHGILALGPTDEGPVVGYICEVHDPDGNICEFSHGQSLGRHAPVDGPDGPFYT